MLGDKEIFTHHVHYLSALDALGTADGWIEQGSVNLLTALLQTKFQVRFGRRAFSGHLKSKRLLQQKGWFVSLNIPSFIVHDLNSSELIASQSSQWCHCTLNRYNPVREVKWCIEYSWSIPGIIVNWQANWWHWRWRCSKCPSFCLSTMPKQQEVNWLQERFVHISPLAAETS